MSWDSSLNTGIDEIDNQHMTLVETIEKFADAATFQKGLESLQTTLAFLEDYVVQHFETEERMHNAYDYPNKALHKRLHDDLIQDIEELKERIDIEGLTPEIVQSTNEFLMSWIINHINSADMDFASYYKQGVKV